MLETLQKIAVRLRPLMPLSVILGVIGAALFAWSAAVADGEGYLIPGLLVALWGAWLFALITGFREVPPSAHQHQPLTVRFRTRLARAGYGAMAGIILASGVAALFLSYRLLALWLD